MKSRVLLNCVAGAALVGFSLTPAIMAQDRDDPDAYHSDRDTYFHGEQWHARLFERVRDDVRHVQEVTWPSGGDQYRLAKTMEELSELQGKMAQRVYDGHEVDDVISALSRVVTDNRMHPRDRDILNDDLARMREFREHHEDWYRR